MLLFLLLGLASAKYEPTWESLESRALPAWYDEAKFGIFCHWGVYSVPAFKSEWFWYYWQGEGAEEKVKKYVEDNYDPGISYAEFAKEFKAELFDPQEFVKVVQSAGARYFVFTSKHVEGYTMWPSPHSWNWNAGDVGPKRDIVKELKTAVTKAGVHFGLYYCLYEWFHPLFLEDMKTKATSNYVEQVTWPHLMELVQNYQPELVWSDGDWMRNDSYWRSKEFLAWLYNDSPVKDTVVVNDRWGEGDMGKHGGYLTFEDKYNPGRLIERKWENCYSTDCESWGNRRNMLLTDVTTVHDLIVQLATTISCGGNFLLNVGPDKHGRIPLIFQERLAELGRFVNATSEAIFSTRPWIYQNDTGNVWYTARYRTRSQANKVHLHQHSDETIIYAWVLDVPKDSIPLPRVKITKNTQVTFLGTGVTFKPKELADIFIVPLNFVPWRQLPRRDVIVLKIEYAGSVTKKSGQNGRRRPPEHNNSIDLCL